MKNNYLHTGNTTKKSSARARPVFRAFGVVAAVTLAGVALAAGPEHLSVRSSKSQIVAENPDASNNHGIAMSGKNPIAEKYDTLVMRVYFRDRAERDRLAQELNAEEVPTTGGYLTVIRDRDLYYSLTARGLRVEIDENSSRNLSDPQILRDTFYGGYKTVEEIYAFLDQKVAQFPNLVEKIDIGDSWCKANPGSCVLPSPWNGYDLFVLHITNRNIPGPKPVFWADGDIHAREIATPEVVMRMIDYLLNNYDTNADVHWLVDYHDIWLMPEVNPDGHHIVEAGGGGNSPYYYRKNGDNVGGGGCSWPPTAFDHFGVDNNRNFPSSGAAAAARAVLCATRPIEGRRRDRSRRTWLSSTRFVPSCPTSAAPATPTRRLSLPQAFTRTSTQLRQSTSLRGAGLPRRCLTTLRRATSPRTWPRRTRAVTVTPMARSSKSCIR